MQSGALRKWVQRHPLVTTVMGVGIGLAAAAGLATIIHFVIQPQMSREMWDRTILRGAGFNLWYPQQSPGIATASELRGRLEVEFDDLLSRMQVDPSEIPLPIDVFVHDTIEQMQLSIGRRKSQQSGHLVYATIDLMAGEDPRPRLTELVLAFGWGECTSQILYTGTTLNIAYPDRSFHTAVSAAPERLRHTMPELLVLEARGQFPQTLYQRYDSPFSPGFVASLADIKALYYEFPSGLTSPLESFVALEAASLVQYMLETEGLASIRAVWGPGTGEAVLARWGGDATLADVNRAWQEAAQERGTAAPDYDVRRAMYLFRAGDLDAAYEETSRWAIDRGASPEEAEWAVRCALAVGAFDAAAARAAALYEGTPPEPVRTWLERFAGWRVAESPEVRVLGADIERLGLLLIAVEEAVSQIFYRLSLPRDDRPARVTVFIHSEEASREVGESLTPLDAVHRTCLHVTADSDLPFALAEALPTYAYGIETYSRLLRRGLATALVRADDQLVAAGCELIATDRWRQLWLVDYTGEDPRIVDVEAGLMIGHVLDRYGPETIRPIWEITSPSGRGVSIDTALRETLGTSRQRIEQELLETVMRCSEAVDRR